MPVEDQLLCFNVLGARAVLERAQQADVEMKWHRIGECDSGEVRVRRIKDVIPFARYHGRDG